MLFMGEEFAASTPFLYFCDYAGDLARAIREGRRAEFAKFPAFSDEATREQIPDPIAIETFERSKLRWAELDEPAHAKRRELVRHLLELRRLHLQPLLGEGLRRGSFSCDGRLIQVDWVLGDGSQWAMRANFGDGLARVNAPRQAGVAFSNGVTNAGDELALGRGAVWIGRAQP
jgi:maltooligosyltrehalose trehalohydrolase